VDLPPFGVIVLGVSPDGPADRAGLREPRDEIEVDGVTFPVGGDIVVLADGQPVRVALDLQRVVFGKGAGDRVELQVWRDGSIRTVIVELAVVELAPGATC
jgi:S1-C subfamily serine protease